VKNRTSRCGQEVFPAVTALSEECLGRVIVQAAARVRALVRKCGICDGQSESRTGFLRRMPWCWKY
jgi:hypothetical protein